MLSLHSRTSVLYSRGCYFLLLCGGSSVGLSCNLAKHHNYGRIDLSSIIFDSSVKLSPQPEKVIKYPTEVRENQEVVYLITSEQVIKDVNSELTKEEKEPFVSL
jgi:hypothetical protein